MSPLGPVTSRSANSSTYASFVSTDFPPRCVQHSSPEPSTALLLGQVRAVCSAQTFSTAEILRADRIQRSMRIGPSYPIFPRSVLNKSSFSSFQYSGYKTTCQRFCDCPLLPARVAPKLHYFQQFHRICSYLAWGLCGSNSK